MAYMSQERKAEITPKVKSILKKFGIKGSLSVRHHSTLSLTAIGCHSLGIYTLILRSLLPFGSVQSLSDPRKWPFTLSTTAAVVTLYTRPTTSKKSMEYSFL